MCLSFPWKRCCLSHCDQAPHGMLEIVRRRPGGVGRASQPVGRGQAGDPDICMRLASLLHHQGDPSTPLVPADGSHRVSQARALFPSL